MDDRTLHRTSESITAAARILGLAAALTLAGCTLDVFQGEPQWPFPDQLRNAYLIPVGRRAPAAGLSVRINGAACSPNVYTDHALGNWLVVPKGSGAARLALTIMNGAEPTPTRPDDSASDPVWTRSSLLIDSDNPAVRKVAEEVTARYASPDDKAAAIQTYVREHIPHKVYAGHFGKKASETLALTYGTCVNRARLFTALCRAAGVPARTVWGYFYVPPPGQAEEGHHEWAEYYGASGEWTALEFDERLFTHHHITRQYVGHIDLLYAAEENPLCLLPKKYGSTLLYMSGEGSWVNGKFGYTVTENKYPSSLTVEITLAAQ